MRFRLLYIFLIFMINQAYSQSLHKSTFYLSGEIHGRDTGSIVLDYENQENRIVLDTLKLTKGKFHSSGFINRACEAILFTDLHNRDVSDSSVIRFLLEPDNIFISINNNDIIHPFIKGSKSQTEKENWDKVRSKLLDSVERYYQIIRALAKNYAKKPDPSTKVKINEVQKTRDSINNLIKALDVKYIDTHPKSFLSGFLLFKQVRKLAVDSAEILYNKLSTEVKKSSFGRSVLSYIYPITNDTAFRQANPLVDARFDRRLQNLHSVFDLSLKDTSGNTIKLNKYKGRYLVIDFWASWCIPCIENIPALEQMTNDFKGDSIQFISISMDERVNDWKQALTKHHFTGIQLSDTTAFSGLWAVYCKVLWVPTYIIADQSGQIIRYNAPQALNPELRVLLNKLIRKNGLSINQSKKN